MKVTGAMSKKLSWHMVKTSCNVPVTYQAMYHPQINCISKGLLNVNLSGNLFQNIYSLAFSFETNSIKKYIQSYQTVTAIKVSCALPIDSNLNAFL